MSILHWLANNNFGFHTNKFYNLDDFDVKDRIRVFKPIRFIRRLQCDFFGHDWFSVGNNGWCSWCARNAGKYPKMRARQPENKKSL